MEKVADYITIIHDGRLILSGTKDDLIYNYAILRCGESQFQAMDRGDIIAFRKRDFQTDVLVSDIRIARRKYAGIVADHSSIDEIMLILIKGERT